LYAARADLSPLVLEGPEPGGQLTTTTDVENFPGYPEGVLGPKMMDDMKDQASRFGADVRYGTVSHIEFENRPFKLTVDEEHSLYAESLIVSTGASAKWLGLESEQRMRGRGVTACATCDGAFFRNQHVIVIGGGDTAMEEATFLTRFASKVTIIHRRDEFRASKHMQKRALNNPKIEVMWNSELEEVLGEQVVDGVKIKNRETGEVTTMDDVTGVFLAIGHKPNTDLFKGVVNMDETGYIITEPKSSRTSKEGIFACGDAQDSIYRQAVTAAGTGCMAAMDAERWLEMQAETVEE
jgi:thioredoxin reductase (NADPH)